jgi:MerR family redox-sensitive transcriptional activator SoxR
MTIGEVAKQAGLSTSALRFYEQAGLLPAPARHSGRRVYENADLDRLAVLQFARACGFRLKEIRDLLAPLSRGKPMSQRWQRFARVKIGELDRLIANANTMKQQLGGALACQCQDVAGCGKVIRRRAAPAGRPRA